MGQDGLLHVGGRLSNAHVQKHPIMLSPKDPLTYLIFQSRHLTLSHCGPTMLFSNVGNEYYVMGARQLARTVCKRCVTCKKIASTVEQQLMGQLPEPRVTEGAGFHTVGVDYAGPYTLKTDHRRKASTYKGYLAVFVCFATKGVHIEVVKGMTTEAFLAAMRRFIGRRSRPAHIYSDNGGNFKGAKKDLEELYEWMRTTDMDEVTKIILPGHGDQVAHPQRGPLILGVSGRRL